MQLPRTLRRKALAAAAILSLVVPGMGLGAELVTAELEGTANDVVVDRGGSATFVISVSVTGLAECYTTHTATVDTEYFIDAAGTVSSGTPSDTLAFFSAIPPTPRVSCQVVWDRSPSPHLVTATVTTAPTTPLGTYSITLSEAAGTTTTTTTGAITTGAPLDDAIATTITVHVLDENRDRTAPTDASVEINDGSTFTNDPTLRLDLAASDNVGITRYRLAQSQAGLSTAIDIPVSPTEANFAGDVLYPLGEFVLDGSKPVWVRFYDAEGNSTDAWDVAYLDRTKPVLYASTAPYTPGTWTDQVVTVTFTCQDEPSIDPFLGIVIAQPSGVGVWTGETSVTLTSSGADQSVTSTVTCIDMAGNVADPLTVGDIDINMGYSGLSGILQPINPDNTSVFSRGKSVPVKFRIGGDEPAGFDTSAWTLRKQQVSCSSFDAIGAEVEPVVENPSNGFRYDAAADQYIYNASFKGSTAGSCWRVVVTLDSGQTLTSAIFRLQS